jgi:hypothetical protein
VGGTSPGNTIFCYRNQTAGEQIVQNAFFTFTMHDNTTVHSLKAAGDYLYAVVQQPSTTGDSVIQVLKLSLLPEIGTLARIDNRIDSSVTDISYDSTSDETSFFIDTPLRHIDQVILTGLGEEEAILDSTVDVQLSTSDKARIVVSGNHSGASSCTAGTKFNATVTLSPIFARDADNNIIPGTLNLRYCVARHHNTGSYIAKVTRKNRTSKEYTFFHETVGATDALLGDTFYEEDGVFKFPVMGFSDDLEITLTSDFPSPMNLTNLELAGKFKRVPHFLTT